MLSSELESCLNQAFHQAYIAHHELLSIEHLLLAILDVHQVREVLEGCGANLEHLTDDLQQHAKANTLPLIPGEHRPVQPHRSVQRVLQRAALHVQASGKTEVGVLNILVAIFTEKHSHAVLLLGRMGVTRLVVVNYLSGLKPPGLDSTR
ncbi:MAG TPA: Clp protease N-terminal domain-containing protein [Steroidobacteraceae bacterium]|nr:Clp protease N-terminal domain-containing protein [Steroidobacteraceae bacterium]